MHLKIAASHNENNNNVKLFCYINNGRPTYLTRLLFRLILVITTNVCIFAQAKSPTYPEIDKPCPYFTLSYIKNFEVDNADVNYFKGKWLILDFWSNNCSGCVKSLPKYDQLLRKYYSKVNIIMVGDDKAGNRSLYNYLYEKLNLQLPSAFDSSLHKQFGLEALPYIVILDPAGIVRGVTYGINSSLLDSFLVGKTTRLKDAYTKYENLPGYNYNQNYPLLLDSASLIQTKVLQHSLIAQWRPAFPQAVGDYSIESAVINNADKIELLGWDLATLYKWAYTGKVSWNIDDPLYGTFYSDVIIESKDSLLFRGDYHSGGNLYCYSLLRTSKDIDCNSVLKSVQQDLEKCFGYQVKIEKRKFPYWKLVASSEASLRLRTKGSKPEYNSDKFGRYEGMHYINEPLSFLIGELQACFPQEPPFVDETRINFNIDLTIQVPMLDFIAVKEALFKQGLNLVKSFKTMNVIVVSDKP